ncbi:3-phosphoshikimate 1-carboxyvinyltransferase [Fodinicola feengrottensis]|uniref:3-phosphoshikimate 1-carboxyvinyltransferase n=1 Tax=Fodinicola feengrottensis TaxID=435914 RepID=A0ABN2GFY9_9ACTN|nr:3-phosphoshikimate 1-carboxyvinyltransferase [Fodinicola feengrottensis]
MAVTTSVITDPWPAPTASGPVDADVRLPGSKSATNRALLLAALSERPAVVSGPMRARDSALMVGGLRTLGVEIDDSDAQAWRVTGGAVTGGGRIDVGLAGTVMRFLPPVAALGTGPTRFFGDKGVEKRPMGMLIDGLRQLGIEVDDGCLGALPLTVTGRGAVTGREVSIDASDSSQFLSALLLAAPRFANGLVLRHTGEILPSAPHLAMTVQMLRAAGAQVDDSQPNTWEVAPGPLTAGSIGIEPDLSNAAPFLAAALVTGGTVRVPAWPLESTQPGAELPALLTAMGATVTLNANGLAVTGGRLRGIDADLRDVSELTPAIAALAALADGPSTLRGVAHIRGHETDRLAALRTEINALGGDVKETADGLVINPKPLHGGVFSTYADHRMATAAAVLGLAVEGVLIENVATTSKTLPEFTGLWTAMLGGGS